MHNRYVILTAQVVSLIFSPFYLPVLAFVVLFFFSYLNYMPWTFNVSILLMVYTLTVLLPRLAIFAYRKLNGWSRLQLGRRRRRYVPYVLSISSYAVLLYLMSSLRMPRFTLAVVAGALAIQVACALVNSWIKVSTHAAASGGLVGAVAAFSALLNFDPTGWLCLCILLSGMVCTARLILRQHTLTEVGLGVLIGIVCGFSCILLI